MQWMPIETAPRDQTEVIVFDPGNKPPVFTAAFIHGWSATAEGRYAPADEQFGDLDKTPTHWMPLPDPPTDEFITLPRMEME